MLRINDILDPDFDWDGIEITEEEFDELSTELVIDYLKKHNPKERQMLALCWNFDNSKEVIQWIVDQPDTDKGTILLLYWYMEPRFYKKFADREECEEEASWALEDYDIIQTIEKNYLSGFYGNQKYAFDPANDEYSDHYDWTSEYEEEEAKAKIPKELFLALEGERIENPQWEEGIPTEISDIMDKLCDVCEE